MDSNTPEANSIKAIQNGAKLEIAYEYGKCELLSEYILTMPRQDLGPALENMKQFNLAARERNPALPAVRVDETDGTLWFPACRF